MFSFSDWLFPKECFVCNKKGSYLCPTCQSSLACQKEQFCPICGRLSIGGFSHPACLKKQGLDGLVSLFPFRSPVGKMLKSFKYHQVRELENSLASLTASALSENKILRFWRRQLFNFTSVPLFPARRLWRGFDQSERILKGTCLKLNLSFEENVLERRRWTKVQVKLIAKKRLRNMIGAFAVVNKTLIKNKNWVVFDDVWTTGSTLKESAKVLKISGAKQVWALTLCC